MPQPPSRASMAAARSPPRSRHTSFWRGPRTAQGFTAHCRRSIFASPVVRGLAGLRHLLGLRDFAPASWSWRRHAGPAFALASPRLAARLNHMKARAGLGCTPSPLRYIIPIWFCALGLPASASGRNRRIAGTIVAAVIGRHAVFPRPGVGAGSAHEQHAAATRPSDADFRMHSPPRFDAAFYPPGACRTTGNWGWMARRNWLLVARRYSAVRGPE